VVLPDNLFSLAQDGEIGQPEEVHLKQPDMRDVLHGKLRHHGFLAVDLRAAL